MRRAAHPPQGSSRCAGASEAHDEAAGRHRTFARTHHSEKLNILAALLPHCAASTGKIFTAELLVTLPLLVLHSVKKSELNGDRLPRSGTNLSETPHYKKNPN
jgi:hypothetical protein